MKKQTEKSIMLGIQSALAMRGWRVWRMPPSIYGQKGLADLCCCRYGITVWIEVKSVTGKLSGAQKRFGEQVTDAGGMYIVARTVDFAVKVCDGLVIKKGALEVLPSKLMSTEYSATAPPLNSSEGE